MNLPLEMTGFDRAYLPPRAIREQVGGEVTAWDLFDLEHREVTKDWASQTLDSIVSSIATETTDALGCTDCQDTGFYGIAAAADPDLLVGLLRRVNDDQHEVLLADGGWELWTGQDQVEILDLDLAGDLAAAITGGACGLLRRYYWPRAFLAPTAVVSAVACRNVLSADQAATPQGEWVNYAVVDDVDQGAVLDLVHLRASADAEVLERWEDGAWIPDTEYLGNPDLPLVELTGEQATDVQAQMAAGALVADAPLTVSPNPKAEKLRRYWSTGKGAAKIRWMTPGDWTRCYRHLRKYMGLRAKGYCANLHKRNDHIWPGDKGLPGSLSSSRSPEAALLSSIRTGQWAGVSERRTTDMPQAMLMDGIYTEGEDENAGILATLTAGGFPVAPPDDWYNNPKFSGPTPMVVEDSGRVYGHIATFNVTHIGMAGAVRAPRSASNYAYFLTGSLKTAAGREVNVGQLTLAGGHAPMGANAADAVKHYDDTNSAVCDVTAGEDRYGIWVAGSLRPDITEAQVRAFRASPISGDWRPINGNLELVAACAVNVPGFMNVRAQAAMAAGAMVALVAAGAQELWELRTASMGTGAVLTRLASLETRLAALEVHIPVPPVEMVLTPADEALAAAAIDAPVVTAAVEEAAVVTPDPAPVVDEVAIARLASARAAIADDKRAALRARIAAGKVPPQFLKNAKKKMDDSEGEPDDPEMKKKKDEMAAKKKKMMMQASAVADSATPATTGKK